MIICIEGSDAVGKATQSKILAERLKAYLFSFPDYSTPAGKAILGHLTEKWTVSEPWGDGTKAQILADAKLAEIDALVLQSLMLTNRLERSADMRAARMHGHVVLDRYDASSLVYGGLDGLDPAWMRAANEQLSVRPDLYILLDAPVEEGLRRRPERRDRYERDVKRMEDVRVEYLKLFSERHEANLARARGDGKTRSAYIPGPAWRIVDGAQPIEAVSTAIWNVVSELL